MRIHIDVDVSPHVKRAVAGIGLACLVGSVATAHANWTTDTEWIGVGKPVSATKLLALLSEADERLSTLESAPVPPTRAHSTVATTVPFQMITTIVFETVEFGGNLNINNGEYTCPSDGKYRVSASARYLATSMSPGQSAVLSVERSGVPLSNLAAVNGVPGADSSLSGSTVVACAKNETLRVRIYLGFSGGTSTTLSAGKYDNWVTFERVGD